jgi:hypothetical protein
LDKIICIEKARKQAEKEKAGRCEHKYVTVYAVSRNVRCVTCGADLDPFDVLLDMTMAYVPTQERDEERAMALEIVRRKNKVKKKEEGENGES